MMNLDAWVEQYRVAWEQADAEQAASLFTEDSRYRSLIFEEPYEGQDGVRTYWTGVTSGQSDVSVQMGTPITAGDQAVVEFWTRMVVEGEPVTLAGALLLRFADDGRCKDLREYWNLQPGRLDPPSGWGG